MKIYISSKEIHVTGPHFSHGKVGPAAFRAVSKEIARII